MGRLLNVGEALSRNGSLCPDKIGARDLDRAMTFRQWNERACRLANALLGLGLAPGDRVAILASNCIEWLELYAALSKAGLVAVPINFRLAAPEIRFIVLDSVARALIVQAELTGPVEEIRGDLDIPPARLIRFGAGRPAAGFADYEGLLAQASPAEPQSGVPPEATAAQMYTSGTTGRPKGAMRSHAAEAVLHLLIGLGFGFTRDEVGLLVMPMCHANSMWFSLAIASFGGSAFVYSRAHFDPEHLLRTLSENAISFTSLVPTHYIMLLGLPERVRAVCDTAAVRRLLISSAPARRDTKLAIMEHFPGSQLFEGYGATEAGWVTLLRPEEQLDKLGSIGREWPGTHAVRLLDATGGPVPDGEVGELFFNTPAVFQGYWNLPDKTRAAFRGDWCSVGDMARRDPDGFYFLADRKSNLIISGGENVYPSEVENALGAHPSIRDVAVIGAPHPLWGEAVHAFVVLHDGAAPAPQEILAFARTRLAGFKVPRAVTIIAEHEMPRTATGKIRHNLLRERLRRQAS